MANIKITDLTAYTDPVSTDVLPIVDVASDVTKKVSIANVMKNASLGSAAACGIAFDGDPNSGLYSPGADQVALATGGTGRLFVDANGKVGLGTSAPGALFHAVNTSAGAATLGAFIQNANSTANTEVRLGFSPNSNVVSDNRYAYIGAINVLGSTDNSLTFGTGAGAPATERMRIDSSGNVGVGTTSPGYALDVNGAIRSDGTSGGLYFGGNSTTPAVGSAIHRPAADTLAFVTASTERARIDSSGRLLVGTSTAYGNGLLQIQGDASDATEAGFIALRRGLSDATIGSDTTLGAVNFAGNSTGIGASISASTDAGTWGSGYRPSRLVFSTTADGAASPTERMRIGSEGNIYINKGSISFGTAGTVLYGGSLANGAIDLTRNAAYSIAINRLTSDGNLIEFYRDSVLQGTISVSGSTVSYNGAHLTRWSQIQGVDPCDKDERPDILRGTVMSNLDEMCEWGDEDNEQLNKTKVSDVEGDKNVAGVFQSWDDDDDTWVNDYYLAMTGDFVIRIGAGVIVERGDLLMSAGDGTAKPQDDDIIRSKTIAKVTSTNVSCTYDDGSYCVPCVLMAC